MNIVVYCRKLFPFSLSFLMLSCFLWAQDSYGHADIREYETAGIKLKYLFRKPPFPNRHKFPVWIFQEGDGSMPRKDIDFKWPVFLSYHLSHKYDVIVVWPELRRHALANDPKAFCELDFFHRVDDLQTLIREIKTDPHVDPNQIVLVGESAGSEIVTLTANRTPGVAAVVTMGGGVIPLAEMLRRMEAFNEMASSVNNQCIEGHYDERSGKFWKQLLFSNLQDEITKTKVPYLAMLGEEDPVIPYKLQKLDLEAVKQMKPNFNYQIVRGKEHTFGFRFDRWKAMAEWLHSLRIQ